MATPLALLKYRIYRATNDLRFHVAMELIEHLSLNNSLSPDCLEFLMDADRFSRNTAPTPNLREAKKYIELHGLDLEFELERRIRYAGSLAPQPKVERLIHIVGAPRSGTSFLYYSLARSRNFAYFTSDSHYRWHAFGVRSSAKTNFGNLSTDALFEDTKLVRGHPDLLFPSEAEHIWHRTLPCYSQLDVHRYLLSDCEIVDMEVLRNSIVDHCDAQQSGFFLSKSPFNSLRIPALQAISEPDRTTIIHIIRNPVECAESITRNGFKYQIEEDRQFSSLEARNYIEKQIELSNCEKIINVNFEDIVSDPDYIDQIIQFAMT